MLTLSWPSSGLIWYAPLPVGLAPGDADARLLQQVLNDLLMQLVQLFSHYFHKVKEKHIRENFVLIYELLDEVCDYGIPQITDPFTLKAYIFQKGEYQTGVAALSTQICNYKFPYCNSDFDVSYRQT